MYRIFRRRKGISGRFIPTGHTQSCSMHNPTEEAIKESKYDFKAENLLADPNKDKNATIEPFGKVEPYEVKVNE